ncbi:MAG: dihydroneopterin aldolase [Vulcanimicrobiaceae bacterium]
MPKLDTIRIAGIRAHGRHGADPGERDHPQPFDVDLEIEADLSLARSTDELAATIDYARIHARIVQLIAERSYRLIERLGDELLADLLCDPRIVRARIAIAKPGLLAGATPSVRLRAERD